MKAGTLEGHFGFGEADGHLDLPASGISEDNSPSVFGGFNPLDGQEIPGFLAMTRE